MNWNEHSKLKGLHAFLGASKYSWVNYEGEETLYSRYKSQFASMIGTALHEIASECITFNFKLKKNDDRYVLFELLKRGVPRNVIDINYIFPNLANFVNDAIGFRMNSEQILFYSDNCFGTADAISFNDKNRLLRVHDYKSGSTPAHMEQLDIYSSIFCLEYGMNPNEIQIEERIYQNEEILYSNPEPEIIISVMDKIIEFDKLINRFKKEGA
ncbi:MAG: hypothetical protein IKP88_21765 [Lachnospiraceae bacterium]|nr:hypothetical protein [Lachnospiraceae bacterium]